jgi:hypothetical protein
MTSSPLSQFDGQLIDGLQFCAKVYALFEQTRSTEGGPSRLRMRTTDLEKKLLEELLPICKYVQAKYRAGRYISVRWVDGDQQFDAEVRQSGAYINQGYFPEDAYLEVTCVMHPNEYLSRELLDKGGVAFGLDGIRRLKTREIRSEPVVHTNREFISSFAALILQQVGKKADINYPPETTLVVQSSLNTLYTPDEWEALVAQVRTGLPNHAFREIFMYDTVSEYSCNF